MHVLINSLRWHCRKLLMKFSGQVRINKLLLLVLLFWKGCNALDKLDPGTKQDWTCCRLKLLEIKFYKIQCNATQRNLSLKLSIFSTFYSVMVRWWKMTKCLSENVSRRFVLLFNVYEIECFLPLFHCTAINDIVFVSEKRTFQS